jgi:hypothetical protein
VSAANSLSVLEREEVLLVCGTLCPNSCFSTLKNIVKFCNFSFAEFEIPGWSSWCSDCLKADRPGLRIPAGLKYFLFSKSVPGPALLGVKLTDYLYLIPRLRMVLYFLFTPS